MRRRERRGPVDRTSWRRLGARRHAANRGHEHEQDRDRAEVAARGPQRFRTGALRQRVRLDESCACDSELAAARDAVRAAGRDVAVAQLVVARSPNASSASDATYLCGTTAHDEHAELDDGEQPCPEATEQVDLIVTALPADRRNDPSIEAVALAAARRLTFGGIFAVYTHGDWTTGRLHDPSRLMIAAAQNADLLYLQHIVTLHTPIRNGRLQPPAASVRLLEETAVPRDVGSPTPHVRVHGDVLVFAQAHADAGQPEELR
ncbi:hypothetical protein [Amycolatopsis sp. NPDC001319]|uniref:hypothetical protein n=1 Tax=unclassified Amycolatopsis TaxID=2618356 RepID=UPI00369DB76C